MKDTAAAGAVQPDLLHARIAHIDGLRAIAILAVIGFHAGWPGFASGFVGVDIFFVISGFLIINQIIERLNAGNFSISEFYARRTMRILPPFLLMLVCSLALAKAILVSPSEWEWYGLSAALASAFLSNFYFLAKQDYFDLGMFEKVLLHTWSLSIEEQFYIVAPLLLVLLLLLSARLKIASGKVLAAASLLIFACSLIGCAIWTTSSGRNYGFYLAPLRAWEFVLGGSIGFLLARRLNILPPIAWTILSIAGVAMTVVSATYLDGGRYPGLAALLPTVAAALLILSGFALPEGIVARALSTKPMVAIGLISYSWYLWHWPLLTLARIADFGDSSFIRDQIMILISFLLAIATYWLVERPVAQWRRRIEFAPMAPRIVAAGALSCFVTMAMIGVVAGLENRSANANALVAGNYALLPATNPACPNAGCPRSEGKDAGFIMGDSHTHRLRVTLEREAKKVGARFLPAVTKPSEIGSQHVDYVVIIRRWAGWLRNPNAERRLRNELTGLSQNGKRRILVIGPVPVFNHSITECILRAEKYKQSWDDKCILPRSQVDASRARGKDILASVVPTIPLARFVDPIDLFCDAELCRPYAKAGILYKDDNHLSQLGADWLFGALREQFLWALTGETAAPNQDVLTTKAP